MNTLKDSKNRMLLKLSIRNSVTVYILLKCLTHHPGHRLTFSLGEGPHVIGCDKASTLRIKDAF